MLKHAVAIDRPTTDVRVFQADPAMTNVRELVEAAVTKIYDYGEVVPEIIDFEGTPLIRRLTLKRR